MPSSFSRAYLSLSLMQSITPGVGLDAFLLNDSFHKILNQFKNHDLNLVYSSSQFLHVPVRLEIRSLGIDLLFKNDKLILILLVNFSHLDFFYHNINLNHVINSLGNHLKTLYNKIFGPTYPGKEINGNYLLDYPGIGFKFDVKNVQKTEMSELLNYDQDIRCKEIMIFGTNSYDSFIECLKGSSAVSTPGKIEPKPLRFSVKSNILLGVTQLTLGDSSLVVKLGVTTQQDILNFLGPPDDYFNKFDTRLLIHNKVKQASQKDNKILKFHNYFKLGVDFLYDLNNSGVITKIILYNGNLIESATFGRWNKCNYVIHYGEDSDMQNMFPSSDISVDSNVYFDQVPDQFKNSDDPILLNRGENESINSDVISINELCNWGESRLYFSDHCIWEVLNNNCISCVTIF